MAIPVIVVFAPTASGKTALAREIFGTGSLSPFKGRGEVVSADSQAVYRGLDIGTAKPSIHERQEIPHHLIDIVSPDVQFGVGEFLSRADSCCADIWRRGKYPLLVGGTGFYIRHFLLGLPLTPTSDPQLRARLQLRLRQEGLPALYAELCGLDEAGARKIHPHDAYRVLRALEVWYSGGRPLSAYALPAAVRDGYCFCTIVLLRGRDDLYRRIDERVEQMFREGLSEEVAGLRAQGYTQDSPGMKAIGYREFFSEGLSHAQIKEKIKHDSHRYAKKQYTYLRGMPGAQCFDADDAAGILSCVTAFCEAHPLSASAEW